MMGAVLPPGVELRPATVRDCAAGAAMHLACWREAYAPLVDPALLEAHLADADRWTAAWRNRIVLGPPRLLAVAGDEVVGFASAGPARHADPPVETELYALYVRAAWHGTGIGQALLDRILADRPAYLWVLEDNRRAQAFYTRNGFAPTGRRQKYRPLDAWELMMAR